MSNNSQPPLIEDKISKESELLTQAQNLAEKHQWADVINSYKQALKINPDNARVYQGLGDAMMAQEMWEDAIAAYQEAIAREPDLFTAYHKQGDALIKLKKWEEGEATFKKALELKPNFHWLHYQLGEAYAGQKRWEEAKEAYGRCVEIKADFLFGHQKLGKVLLELHQWEEAQECFEKAIALKPDYHWAHYSLGEALIGQKNWEAAVAALEKAIEIKPDLMFAHQKLGDAFLKQGKWGKAEKAFKNAIKLQPDFFWSHYGLGEAFASQQKWLEAVRAYQSAVELSSDFAWGYYQLAVALAEIGEYKNAISTYKTALNKQSDLSFSSQKLDFVLRKKAKLTLSVALNYYSKINESDSSYRSEIHNVERQKYFSQSLNPKKIYILETDPRDSTGLGVVYRKCTTLGELVSDSTEIRGKVLLAGRPDLYCDFIEPTNVNYLWTTFESSEIPKNWVSIINTNFREVFVPHREILEVFRRSGVRVPLKIIPQGYPKRKRTNPLNKKEGLLRLGTLGGPARRKNFDKLIEAVLALRQQGRNVELLIHCPWLGEQQQKWKNLPGIKLTEGNLSDDEIEDWYSQLDAFIYPSSGEGWSFTPRESMSMGIPTIVTDIPVHRELVESRFFLTICSDKWEPAYYEFLDDNCGVWKHYLVEEIANAIVELMDNYDRWYELAQKGMQWIANQWQWDSIQERLLAEIFPQHLLFCSTQYEKCGIHTYSEELVSKLPQTKYVGSYQHIEKILQREAIKSVHVQYEKGIVDTQELYANSIRWNCYKQITLHSLIRNSDDAAFQGMLTAFDKIFVLNKEARSEIPRAEYLPHGCKPPLTAPLLPELKPPILATFGFIHENKGYPYMLEAAKRMGLKLRIVGEVKRDIPQRQATWAKYIENQEIVEHIDGFFPEEQVLHLLSEASVLVFYYRDSDYLYQSGSVLTAARCQRPIICSTSSPLKDFQGCVHYVPYGDLEALIKGIKLVLESSDYAQNLVRAMNDRLENDRWDIIAKRILRDSKLEKRGYIENKKIGAIDGKHFVLRETNRIKVSRVAVVGNYLPRKCGIATFTTDLCNSLSREYKESKVMALAMNDISAGYAYPKIVRFEIEQNLLRSYYSAADFLNKSGVDVVCLQHEYGIFGGAAGQYVLKLLERLEMPVFVTLHTVLQKPDPDRFFVIKELERLCEKLIVMSDRGEQFLQEVFNISNRKIQKIFHGVHDTPLINPNIYKMKFGLQGKNVILTFGLLGRGKGIEYGIEAMSEIVKYFPDTVYLCVGATHPHLVQHEGESYRESLQELASKCGVGQNVKFINKFCELDELLEYIGAADIYLTPYLNPAQITSGTLAYAVAAGKPVISTPYWHAEELLADNRGILVPFKDSKAIAQKVIQLLTDKNTWENIRKNAYNYGRQMTWQVVAQKYMQTFMNAI